MRIFTPVLLMLVLLGLAAGGCTDAKEQIRQQNEAAGSGDFEDGANEGSVSVFDLRPGDCISEDIPDETTEHGELEAVACTSTDAVAKVVNLVLIDAEGDYPEESFFDEEAALRCDAETTSFMFPTVESWDAGDRTIVCMADV
jgi:hypothetical protein